MIVPQLDRLPQELIDQIASNLVVRFDDDEHAEDLFEHRDELDDLSKLSRTTKRLYHACAPTLFRRVTLRTPVSKTDARILRFLQTLRSKPYLAAYVRAFQAPGGKPPGANGGIKKRDEIYQEGDEFIEFDPVAPRLLKGRHDKFWEIAIILSLKMFPHLVALTTTPAVMQLVTRWPEGQRLRGSSITALKLVHAKRVRSDDNYCEDMFEWKQAFQPGETPAALHSLLLEHYRRLQPEVGGNHIHRQLDSESLRLAADLRHLQLRSWIPQTIDDHDCLARLGRSLSKCTSLSHLTISDQSAPLEAVFGVICNSRVTPKLQRLDIHMDRARGWLELRTLSQLSRFTHVTSLTLPQIYIVAHLPWEGTIWPPSLQSLTLSVVVLRDVNASSLQTMLKAKDFSAAMQDITFMWCIDKYDAKEAQDVLSLIDYGRACDKEFASSGIVLLHEHPDPKELDSTSELGCFSTSCTSTHIERDFLKPLLQKCLTNSDDLTDEERQRVDTILNGPSDSS